MPEVLQVSRGGFTTATNLLLKVYKEHTDLLLFFFVFISVLSRSTLFFFILKFLALCSYCTNYSMAPNDLDPTLKDLTQGAEALIFPDLPMRTPTPFPETNENPELHENHTITEPADISTRRKPRPMKRPKKFYHVPVKTDYTLPEVLLQQHAELLELINYDAFMDTLTTGRFGKWDTTLSIHNSANNSRGSKTSKNSGSSRKRKEEEKKKEAGGEKK